VEFEFSGVPLPPTACSFNKLRMHTYFLVKTGDFVLIQTGTALKPKFTLSDEEHRCQLLQYESKPRNNDTTLALSTMDLPFAVDPPTSDLHQSNASLVSASTQGSFLRQSADFDSNNLYAPTNTNLGGGATPIFVDAFEHFDQGQSIIEPDMEMIDFMQYVSVSEADATDFDVVINPENEESDEGGRGHLVEQGDLLHLLMSGNIQDGELIVSQCEEANAAAHQASEAKKHGDLGVALENHSLAAKLFRDAAIGAREKDVSLSNALLLLSQSQAKSALALKQFLKLQGNNSVISSALTQKERLRATVRGALVTKKEADISDSIFLGKATKSPHIVSYANTVQEGKPESTYSSDSSHSNNAVDEMLELERELRDMDSALELGNSVSSLGARTQNRLKQLTMDGSFMVVPPGSSYMSSSAIWSRPTPPRAKANRIQPMMGASATAAISQSTAVIVAPPQSQRTTSHAGLDASWWGNASTTSQVLAGSVVSIASSRQHESTNTKQLMRLLDSIKTLSDENAALLREVEQAEAARMEAKATREQMTRFKAEYGKRFNALKSALEKFRTNYAQHQDDGINPVTSSEYLQSDPSSTISAHATDDRLRQRDEQLVRQEQLIRKLTADLRKEKDESKKKDVALRKYESFYREVKARSAEKARQRESQQQRRGFGGKG
jgi:hypothetical protein